MISDSELSDLINVPKEWRNGDEKIIWPRSHDKFNLDWLETLWKYLCENCQNDLTMMENINIIYTLNNNNTKKSTAKKDSPTSQSNLNESLTLYKLSKNSNLVYTPPFNATNNTTTNINNEQNNELSEETYASLVKILNKLGFQCIESISQIVLNHPLFFNYVPNLKQSRFNLLRAFRNKYKHASIIKITQDFNALLNDQDIKVLQLYLAKIDCTNSNQSSSNNNNNKSAHLDEKNLLEILKELPIFENGALECSDKYIPLKEASLIYDTPIKLPFELPGIRPFILVQENETKLLIIEKLNLTLVKDFSVIIKEIIKYCTSKELNALNSFKVHTLGKWLLLNCASYILANMKPHDKPSNLNKSASISNDLVDCIKNAKLFMNQNQELCSANQFINPLYKDRFISIIDPKWIPSKDLISEEKCVNILRELKMRNCLELKVDEIIDLYEHSIKQNDNYRRLFAELIVDILVQRIHDAQSADSTTSTSIDKALNEYSTTKAVTLRHFLMSVSWIPIQRDRPQSYPQSLFWKGGETNPSGASTTSNPPLKSSSNGGIKFASPRDCVDSQYAYCAGSVSCVADLEVPAELKPYIDLRQVHLDTVVRHLKLITKCFDSSALKTEWYDYLTVSKKCYEFMSTYEPQDIYRELKANDLNEWIWNGTGFSSIHSIYIITEKEHPLCSHTAVLPYELYIFVKFFETLGIRKLPDLKQLEIMLLNCVKSSQKILSGSSPTNSEQNQLLLENAAKNYPLINWIKLNYSSDKRLLTIIKDYEENLINISPLGSNGNLNDLTKPFIMNKTPSSPTTPTAPASVSLNDLKLNDLNNDLNNLSDNIYLYLPELYKSVEIRDNLINSVITLIKNKQIKILDEEAYLMRKVSMSLTNGSNTSTTTPTKNNNIFDHHRVYNEIILPNLNSLSKNVKDAVVLFALDHADPKMLEILRDHPCIPVSPFGRKLKKPNKLVHPMGKIAPLYSDTDERFPCGSEETYIREDRLQILKILGMKCDHLSWAELVERADSVTKIREYDLAIDRSIAILNVLNEMLTNNHNIGSPQTHNSNSNTNTNEINGHHKVNGHHKESREEKEAKFRACELIRDIAFIPVKPKPYQKLNLTWLGDKFKFRFAKPKELLSGQYEMLCSTQWPVPLNEYKKRENIFTKQIEQFLGLDDLTSKFSLKDALRQLDEVCKINLPEIDDAREVKIINDMCYQLYEYVQSECQKKPNDHVPLVRAFFADRKCILVNEEFVNVNQLCWHLNVNLKSMFYQIPSSYLRSFKYLFNHVLNIKVNLDLPDLLHVVESVKKKYKDFSVTSKEDFNVLMNVYGMMIDQGYQIITNLYLPNVNAVLQPARSLYFHPMSTLQLERPEDYVHPAVDRRICVIAGVTMNKKLADLNGSAVVNDHVPLLTIPNGTNGNGINHFGSPNSVSNQRIFPRVFGNKRLEGILARLDDDKIDMNLVNNLDEGNPQIILDYLIEANRIHSLSAFLSEEDSFVLMKYFNDFLARNYQSGTFQRLKELKIYKPLWSDKYINLNFTGSSLNLSQQANSTSPVNFLNNLASLNNNSNVPNVYLISEEMSSLMKRSFKQNPFIQKSVTNVISNGSTSPTYDYSFMSSSSNSTPFIILVRRNELAKLYAHLNLLSLNDLEAFLHLCLPQFRKLDAKSQNNFLKYLYEEILEKSFIHEKEKCFKILREKLFIQTRKGEQQLISDLYDWKSEALRNILNDSYFPDENFDSPQCLRFLKEAGLRTYLPSELCKKCMNEIEKKVSGEDMGETTNAGSGWTDELRTRSKWIYTHLIENWQKFDDSVLQQRFLEPYCPEKRYLKIKEPFEYSEFNKTCLKLSDAELKKYELIAWTSSYILPSYVDTDSLDSHTIEFLKLNRKPCFATVNQHLTNICESVGSKSLAVFNEDQDNLSKQLPKKELFEDILLDVLSQIYQYLDELSMNEHQKDICKQLEDKDIVWSSSTRKFVAPAKICIQLDAQDEIPPFLYSFPTQLQQFKSLFIRLGSKNKPYAMLYGDILRKMAKVCGDDYLNSNELCKALKAMECFFKYLKSHNQNVKNEDGNNNNNENISSQYKLPGLYFVTTELKLEKSSGVVILDNKENLDDIAKLPQDKFVFNPGEKVFKMNTNEIKPLIDKIFISQRPTLFTQKYEATYDFTLPDDPDSQRQNLLTSLERKYQQIFTSRQLHRCLARCISNEEARQKSPKHLPIDEVEKVIRERLSSIKVTCVEYLETSLSYRKLSQQQKIEQTVEEKACYLTHESLQFATLYVSKKHIEQPYFTLCLAKSLQPLFTDLHFDYSIFTSLIATSVSQMSRLLQLANVATEENILSVIKLQYIPSSGKLYGDDINLLAQFDPKFHNVLISDLCVYANTDGTYIYCQIINMKPIVKPKSSPKKYSYESSKSNEPELEYEFTISLDENGTNLLTINQKDLYVLENWHRIYDAMIAKPPDERESFKYQESSSSKSDDKRNTNGSDNNNDDNFSSNASDSEKSDTSSNYGSNEFLPNSAEIEQSKSEVNQELRLLWGLEENERKKKINRLLLKWHPDKNPGKEKFASEVFKHLKKQIELYKNDPFLANFYRSSYSSSSYGYGSGTSSSTANSAYGSTGATASDDFKSSRHYGSFDDLHRKGSSSPTGGSPHSSPSRESHHHHHHSGTSYDYEPKGPGASNLGRAGSFRQEWERRRQQKRQTAGADQSMYLIF